MQPSVLAHVGHWLEPLLFAPAFVAVVVAIVRSVTGRHGLDSAHGGKLATKSSPGEEE